MANAQSAREKDPGALCEALTALVRLLARQAAAELLRDVAEVDAQLEEDVVLPEAAE